MRTESLAVRANPFLHFFNRQSLNWPSHLAVFFSVAALIVWRRPDALFNPQFYAEDASWYLDAYSLGWLHPLLSPAGGYLNTFPRLIAALAQLVPFRFAPLFMNVCGIVVQALPVNALLSSRCAGFGSFGVRALMAAAYVALPNSAEIHVNITNAQFHLALLVFLFILGAPPTTPIRKLLDLTALVLCALTGPFCVVLLPLVLVFWWQRRHPWSLLVASVLAFASLIQLAELFYSPGRTKAVLGASFQQFIRILDTQVLVAALQGRNSFASHHHFSMLVFVAVVCIGVVTYCLIKSPPPLQLFLVFAAGLFVASLQHPLIISNDSAWRILQGLWGIRYWFFPMLAFLWSLIWCAATPANPRALRWFAAALLSLALKGVVHDWRFAAYNNRHFQQSADAFQKAAPGSLVIVPTVPIPWTLHITRKGPNCDAIPLGEAETPLANQTLSGPVPVAGWLTGARPVDRVSVYLDKTLVQTGVTKGKRPDVDMVYPLTPNIEKAWSLAVDPSHFAPGQHILHIRAMDREGCDSEFAQIPIVIAP